MYARWRQLVEALESVVPDRQGPGPSQLPAAPPSPRDGDSNGHAGQPLDLAAEVSSVAHDDVPVTDPAHPGPGAPPLDDGGQLPTRAPPQAAQPAAAAVSVAGELAPFPEPARRDLSEYGTGVAADADALRVGAGVGQGGGEPGPVQGAGRRIVDLRHVLTAQERAQWEAENQWWTPRSGVQTHKGEVYSPDPDQCRNLIGNNLTVLWVIPDGDCSFNAVTDTVPQDVIRDRIRQAALRWGIEVPPEETVPGKGRRPFLADLVDADSVLEPQHRWPVGTFYETDTPGEVPGETLGQLPEDALTRPAMAEALRRLTEYGDPYGNFFPAAVAYFLDLPLQVLLPGERDPLVLPRRSDEPVAELYTIVLVNQHYLATIRRPDSPAQSAEAYAPADESPSESDSCGTAAEEMASGEA